MSWFRRTFAIAAKEFLQLSRDRLTAGMVIGVPVIQLVLFGYAINMDVRNLPIAIVDHANTTLSRQVVQAVEASQVVKVTHILGSAKEIEELMERGAISAGIFLPHDFERRTQDPSRPAAQIMIDASDPVLFGIARSLQSLVSSSNSVPVSIFDKPAPFFEVRAYYNPERRSEVQIVPALIGVILTLTMVLFTAVAIVREKERGTIEFLITTPIKTLELMVGKIIPYILIGLTQVAIILLLGQYLFQVPMRGSLIDLYIGALFFIAASLTLGLLISTVAKSQFQAFQLTLFAFLPSILLSGFMFPFDGMPKWAQVISEVLPLTHFIRIVRAIILRGADLWQMAPDLWAMIVFFVVAMTLAVMRFQKRLD